MIPQSSAKVASWLGQIVSKGSLRLERNLSPEWQLTAEYRASDNDSHVDGFAYERHRAALAVNRAFP